MWRALAIKELREVGGIAAIALVAGCVLAVGLILTHVDPSIGYGGAARIPFVDDMFPVLFGGLAACLAIALGIRQSVGESLRGTYPFLLHLPLPRGGAIFAKLATGAGVYLVVGAMPIILYAGWAATPGTHASPFLWGMTDMTMRLYLTAPVLYLGGFLSGLRPAAWFGTRLLPLVGSASLALVIHLMPWWWMSGLALLAATLFSLTACICDVAHTRDF